MSALAPTRIAAVLLGFLVFSSPVDAQDSKLTALLQRSPAPPNAIGYLHSPSLKRLMKDADITAVLTDNLEEVWLVSELNTISLTPRWEAGYALMNKDLSAGALAEGLGGYVESLAGKEVVWTPRQTYLVAIGNKQLGFLRPARRSLLAEWLTATDSGKLSGFLVQQAKQPEQYLSMMVAIDLENTFSPVALESRIKELDSLNVQDHQAVTELLCSIQGLAIIIGRRSLAECILTVEFAQSPAILSPVANRMLNEILKRNGTSAPEVASWAVKVDGNKLAFQGAISADTLEGLLGVFSVRREADHVAESLEAKPKFTAEGPNGYDSKKYFDKVVAYIERVRKYEAQSTGYRAKWNDQQARKIDELSTINIDPQLIDYGANVSSLLRTNALTIRTGNIAAGQVQAAQGLSQGYGYSYGYGYGSGYYDPNSSGDYQQVTGAQQRGAAYGDYRTTLSTIDKLTGEVRRAMTDKYQMQF